MADFARFYDKAARGQSSYFVWLNCGKESVVLDIKEPTDRKLLGKLSEKADVFIQNLAPSAMARAGFDSAMIPSASGRVRGVSQVGCQSRIFPCRGNRRFPHFCVRNADCVFYQLECNRR